jgi:Fur family peroxide stress response transcriptional regulator
MKINTYKEKIKQYIAQNHLVSMSQISEFIPEANFSTIFRNVEQMVNDNELKKIVFDKDNIKYELADHNHNHFVCDTCGDVDEIEVKIKDKTKVMRDAIVHGFCSKCK